MCNALLINAFAYLCRKKLYLYALSDTSTCSINDINPNSCSEKYTSIGNRLF